MRVIALNVGRKSFVQVRERRTETGLFKVPVADRRRVHRLGVEGDFRAEPRKFGEDFHALHIYPHEHYAHWARLLGREELTLGQFGENLTTVGLSEAALKVGTRLRIGSVAARITQPRIPCRKLDVRMETSRFSGAFLRSGRVGFHLSVEREGEIGAGDDVEILDVPANAPTVLELLETSQLEYWDVEALESMLATDVLIPAWREMLAGKLERAHSARGWAGQRSLRVTATTESGALLHCARGRALPRLPGATSFAFVVWRPHPFDAPIRARYELRTGDQGGYALAFDTVDPALSSTARVTRSVPLPVEAGDILRVEAPRDV